MSNTFALTAEQAEALLRVLGDLREGNLSTLTVASRTVYMPPHWDRERTQVYADAIERLVFTTLALPAAREAA
jgi:hypothetical protein